MTTARISLDSPVFAGRLRTRSRRPVVYERRAVEGIRPRLTHDARGPVSIKTHKTSFQKQSVSHTRPKLRTAVAPHPRITRSNVLRRNTVKAPTRRHKQRIRFSSKKALFALAVLLFLFGLGVGIDGLRANKEVIAQVQSIQHNSSADLENGSTDSDGSLAAAAIPDEEDRPNMDSYRVAADLPRALYIPKLDVKARILHVGVTKDGAVAAPSNILDAGWYKESAKPGQTGAMLIDGHVHGPTKPGVFSKLKNLKAGDEITIERGDGKVLNYTVIKTKTYPADSGEMMGAALTPVTPGKLGLNLITCTGELDKSSNHYKDRLVVFAEQK